MDQRKTVLLADAGEEFRTLLWEEMEKTGEFSVEIARDGNEILKRVKERMPDLLVSGKEARRLDWFDSVAGVRIAELYIPKTVEISASQMRQFLVRDDRESWERYVNPKMHALYPELRALVLASQGKEDTMSV